MTAEHPAVGSSPAVASRRKAAATIEREFPGATVLDLTSRGSAPWVRFSPFYPHGGLPVPFSPGVTAESVEGVWQGLKVFETADVDPAKFAVSSMKGLKRTVRRFGPVRGHRRGVGGTDLLDYAAARRAIYLPTYRFVLENRVADLVEDLRALCDRGPVVLLDYETNGDLNDLSKPLSHAALVAKWVRGEWGDVENDRSF
ncbi:DUF6939 family protein [Alienimonas chondri]|uniref:Uncharacterized protein n=1 Tax=Alienimonas chondri TaxID=2681879 RepID=A0ABX1VJ94_9PLAN|nr:hypothetical protein [Alienimonas chondri]NNJ27531.1 hypothetical protein [Alienimonas chondri]